VHDLLYAVRIRTRRSVYDLSILMRRLGPFPARVAEDVEACDECDAVARKARGISEDTGLPPSSAKIRMLLKLLRDIDQRSGSKEKTIVFSQVRALALWDKKYTPRGPR
jgi:hypothetical protein